MDLEERVNKLWEEIQQLVDDAKKLEGKIPEGYMLKPPYYASDVEKEEEEIEEEEKAPEEKPIEQNHEIIIVPPPEPKKNDEDSLEFILDIPEEDLETCNPTIYYSPPRYRPMRDFDQGF